MEYRSGSVNRAFVLRFDDGDDFLSGLKEVIRKENIRNGWFHVIGGMREADVVIGPKEPVMPPDPVWQQVRTTQEMLGTGSIYWDEQDEPKIHLHTSLGDHGEAMTVCMRDKTKTYLVLEVYILEITGFQANRPWFAKGGFNRLSFSEESATD